MCVSVLMDRPITGFVYLKFGTRILHIERPYRILIAKTHLPAPQYRDSGDIKDDYIALSSHKLLSRGSRDAISCDIGANIKTPIHLA